MKRKLSDAMSIKSVKDMWGQLIHTSSEHNFVPVIDYQQPLLNILQFEGAVMNETTLKQIEEVFKGFTYSLQFNPLTGEMNVSINRPEQ
jgi:hypothetical protein